MKPQPQEFRRAIQAGLAATLILVALMYIAPLAGLPNIDMAYAIGTRMAGHAAFHFTLYWWIGLAIFILMGSIASPIVFSYAFPGLLGSAWQRGAEWGIIVWTFAGTGVMVMMGVGFNEAHFAHPVLSVLSSLAGHVVYGALLGVFFGAALARQRAQQAPISVG